MSYKTYAKECWQRHYTWCSLIPGYDKMTQNQKKAAKKEYKENNMQLHVLEVVECASTSTEYYDDDNPHPFKKKNKDMNTFEYEQKNYARNRLYEVYENKLTDLKRKFGLADDREPSTAEELIKRIKDGKYIIREEGNWFSPYGMIRWRDPDLKEDKNSYKDARDELEKTLGSYKDRMMLGTHEEILTALQEFEAL